MPSHGVGRSSFSGSGSYASSKRASDGLFGRDGLGRRGAEEALGEARLGVHVDQQDPEAHLREAPESWWQLPVLAHPPFRLTIAIVKRGRFHAACFRSRGRSEVSPGNSPLRRSGSYDRDPHTHQWLLVKPTSGRPRGVIGRDETAWPVLYPMEARDLERNPPDILPRWRMLKLPNFEGEERGKAARRLAR